jgi:DeoR/GlpR family transcriptional regulator of sugar metabolism
MYAILAKVSTFYVPNEEEEEKQELMMAKNRSAISLIDKQSFEKVKPTFILSMESINIHKGVQMSFLYKGDTLIYLAL